MRVGGKAIVTTALQINEKPQTQETKDVKYTVITFAPVQGFIEKSRKLRDLYGASQILSYLSWKIVCAAKSKGFDVISPAISEDDCINVASVDIVQGMPNRILIKGDFSGNDAHQALMEGWKEIVEACRKWLGENLEDLKIDDSGWARSWARWKIHAWEVFWGGGDKIEKAMQDLETRKLRRGWTVPNWNGESSSLSGHDAIAYPNMDREITHENKRNESREREEIINFYERLAAALEGSKQKDEPKYLDPSEKLSIPELIKRLVTHHQVSTLVDQIANENRVIKHDDPKPVFRIDNFSELLREDDKSGYWTGWFMGDGDEVGKHLKSLIEQEDVKNFSLSLRDWGKKFQNEFDLGRVVYAGGDDFFGVMYGDEKSPQRSGTKAIDWLLKLRNDWRGGKEGQPEKLGIKLSLGFVWAGHSVPQRDVLQHCREAEKLAKNLGRDRVTIRVVFNNGQYVQWTTPWECLEWLKDYKDRDGKKAYCKNKTTDKLEWQKANWNHVYSDLGQLKARHAIPPATAENPKDDIAIELLSLYFDKDKDKEKKKMLSKSKWRKHLTGIDGDKQNQAVIAWIEGMILVGWQLCSNI
ncbi:MAG: Cas10/Cmr2 second palm domain-containing protein [Pseudanabaena sp.]|jgi:CRISPR-associated protein Cmr2